MRLRKLSTFFLLPFLLHPVGPVQKASSDFSWLKEFLPLTESLYVDHWEKDSKITFDENGWVQVNKQSNPVTLSQYALVCFDTFRSTGDNRYKKAFLNQVKYLMSDKQYKVLGPDRIGYPYKFTFHDLKPDWYSGLAQAEAICVLIRYYYLTRDEQALKLIVQLKNHMLWPMEDGGLLAKTPEGGIWIEEYPNSKQNKHVLNGFLISIIGLYEYTMLFPGDREAKKTYEKCLESLKASVGNYDTGSWLQYDRGTKSGVSNWYMKAQVIEMKMIYTITNDRFFYHLYLLWCTYAYNRPLTFIGCRINEKNFSIPVKQAEGGWYQQSVDYSNVVTQASIKKYENGTILPNHGTAVMFDRSTATYFQPISIDSIRDGAYAVVLLKKNVKVDRLSLLNLKDSIPGYAIEVFYMADSLSKWKSVQIKKTYRMDKELFFQFNEIDVYGLKINFRINPDAKVMIAELNLQNSQVTNEATYVHYLTEALQVGNKRMKFSFEARDLESYTVFYKYAQSKSELMKAKWNPEEYSRKIPFETESCGSFYQYLIVFKPESSRAALRNIKVY